MRGVAVLAFLLACAPGCHDQAPGSVDLTIIADPSLSDATVAAIKSLEVDASGAATGSETFPLAQAFGADRQERLGVRPGATSGTLTLAVLARAADGTALAFGQTMVGLTDGTVSAQVVLTGNLPGDAGTDGGDASTQLPSVSLVAGSLGGIGCVDGIGAAARFNNPRGGVFTGGKLYVADMYNNVIRVVTPDTGTVTTLAGKPLHKGSADGVGPAARFDRPHGITTDGTNLYVTDMRNDTIRQIVIATGAVTTLAGTAGQTGSTDMPGAAARFDHPHGIVYDGNGNLFVADTHNQTIRKIVISGAVVSTLAGLAGTKGSTDNATGSLARFNQPHGITFAGGNLYVADTANNVIRQVVASSGATTTPAGTAGQTGSDDGTGAAARFNGLRDLVFDGALALYVVDTDNSKVRKMVLASAVVSTVTGGQNGSKDGVGVAASFSGPMAIATDGNGTLFVADGWGQTLRRVAVSTESVSTLAGAPNGEGLADGNGAAALFKRPHGLCVVGNQLYVADKRNDLIRQIDLGTGAVTTLAGSITGSSDGMGSAAQFNGPWGLATDGAGTLFIADAANQTIRQLTLSTGLVTTLAGTAGQKGSTTNVVGAAARFNGPAGLAYLNGTLYVADSNNATVRAIDVKSANVTTLAGTAGSSGSMDAQGAAARFNGPTGLAIEGGVLYVADQNNHTIRSISLPAAMVGTVAGSPGAVGSADGPGSMAHFFYPSALSGDGAGNLYIADTRNHTVRKIAIASTMVSTFAGQAGVGGVQLGALPSTLNTPSGVAIGPSGELLLTTTHENAILSIH
jgi:sugar lactone lactonase YvrE